MTMEFVSLSRKRKEIARESCREMKNVLLSENFKVISGKVIIYGEADYVNDGDGHYDDMTDHYVASFCPFCGRDLRGYHDERE